MTTQNKMITVSLLNKVAGGPVFFWIIKMMFTTIGETAAARDACHLD